MKAYVWPAVALALTVFAGTAQAAPRCSAASAEGTTVLVELFTSEGCNSCPPADRWLSGLATGGDVPRRVVPIAWHVDYWDYIGWKDRFAQAAFSARQRQLSEIRRERVVYTPQVLVQGQDFRRWRGGEFDAVVAQVNGRPARAKIELSIVGRSATHVEVEAGARLLGGASPPAPAEGHALYVAAYASGLSTEVQAGENAGRNLRHDFVAFGWSGPIPLGPRGEVARRARLALPAAAPGMSGVIAYVQNVATAEVIQALMLPACPG